ncbi:hypothetical protein DY000_02022167 [Brassica cretica]|uniref:Uncharacterized protein n=1 Tax=Brassica cretica TaxID=69181 RepID=A0ABQ7EAF7_BRACR|nr:hypothetical protein DY000_02022167 [Brassica cretica]
MCSSFNFPHPTTTADDLENLYNMYGVDRSVVLDLVGTHETPETVDVMATSDFSVGKLDLPQILEDLPEDFFEKVPSAADDVAKCSGDRFEDGEFSNEE